MLAIIEGNSLYICSDQDHDGDDKDDNLFQLIWSKQSFLRFDHHPLRELTFQEDCNIEDCGLGWSGERQNLRNNIHVNLQGFLVSNIHDFSHNLLVSNIPSLKTWLLLMLEMLLTLSSILATSSSDSTWLVIRAKLKRSCSVECKPFVWQVISYQVFNVLTLVSVSMPLSNTFFWILNACLKKERCIVDKLQMMISFIIAIMSIAIAGIIIESTWYFHRTLTAWSHFQHQKQPPV